MMPLISDVIFCESCFLPCNCCYLSLPLYWHNMFKSLFLLFVLFRVGIHELTVYDCLCRTYVTLLRYFGGKIGLVQLLIALYFCWICNIVHHCTFFFLLMFAELLVPGESTPHILEHSYPCLSRSSLTFPSFFQCSPPCVFIFFCLDGFFRCFDAVGQVIWPTVKNRRRSECFYIIQCVECWASTHPLIRLLSRDPEESTLKTAWRLCYGLSVRDLSTNSICSVVSAQYSKGLLSWTLVYNSCLGLWLGFGSHICLSERMAIRTNADLM